MLLNLLISQFEKGKYYYVEYFSLDKVIPGGAFKEKLKTLGTFVPAFKKQF